jgi:sialidase-1
MMNGNRQSDGIRFGGMLAGLLVIAILTGRSVVAATPSLEQIDVFLSGKDGYNTYRIPALAVTKKGTVLAFCEGRKNSGSDTGDIDLVLKRSTDGGRTWSDMQMIADDGDHTMGQPCPVVDQRNGTIWLPLCRDNKRVLLTNSTDDGKTWSEPAEITKEVVDPAWPWIGTGPGHGIQLTNGRLVIPCWAGKGAEFCGQVQVSFVFYSDDGGKTWQRASLLDDDASDECEVVELVDGSLYMNMRSRQEKRQRAYSFSKDGGQSWSAVKYDARVPEPSCQGGIIRFTREPQFDRNRILLACPANPAARDHFTVRVTYDECGSWPVSKVLYSGGAGYSDLAVTNEGQALCLFEADNCGRLVLARFNIEWLTNGRDSLARK